MNFVRHLQMLGPAGLSALMAGGSVLIFVSLNTLWTTRTDKNAEASPFQHGSELSIQAWLAILGVGFGCISYGLNEAYVHFFDAWCSHLARREEGLNYGRYLNSQARAPVVYGMRGFPVLVTARYALSIISIATSPTFTTLYNNTISPWLSDSLANKNVRGFTYLPLDDDDLEGIIYRPYRYNPERPWQGQRFRPGSQYGNSKTDIAMVAVGDCTLPAGTKIITWELAMMASVSEDEGRFKMDANHTKWMRTEASHQSWRTGDNSTESAHTIVDYRIKDEKFQIQWAPAGAWMTAGGSEPVARRLTYSFTKILANVTRTATEEGCFVSRVEFAKTVEDHSEVKDHNDTIPHVEPWAAPIVSDRSTSRAEGIAAIVRMLMTRWFGKTKIGPAPLTSWMGQHVYLALNRYTSSLGREDLLPGQDAASDEFARMKLSAHVTHPSDWRREYVEVGADHEDGLTKAPLKHNTENQD